MVQRRILRNRRRWGEGIMIASGIALSLFGLQINIPQIQYGGLCIIGLGIFSVFWR